MYTHEMLPRSLGMYFMYAAVGAEAEGDLLAVGLGEMCTRLE